LLFDAIGPNYAGLEGVAGLTPFAIVERATDERGEPTAPVSTA
jgi:hypothetical protein